MEEMLVLLQGGDSIGRARPPGVYHGAESTPTAQREEAAQWSHLLVIEPTFPPCSFSLARKLRPQERVVLEFSGVHLECNAAGGDQVATLFRLLPLSSTMEHGEPEGEIRGAPEVPLAKSYKERDLLEAQRTEVAELDLVEVEKLAKESGSREREPTLEI